MKPPELVVIGTSLGGLNALTKVLGGLPEKFRVPVTVVQHRTLSPAGSGLAKLLQQSTPLTVVEAEDKMALEPGRVYLAPADYHLMIEEPGRVALSTDGPVRAARPSIDVLFQTAADAYREALLGVLLTGASHDGSAGVAAIRRCGGRVWIQAPSDARVPAMPSAALERAGADAVLTLDQLCRRFAAPAP